MTTPSRLDGLLGEIVGLLRQCGHADKAGWLEERRAVIASADATPDAREHASNEIHGVVLGMGGLMDLSLTPVPESSYTSASARQRLDALSDTLNELTR